MLLIVSLGLQAGVQKAFLASLHVVPKEDYHMIPRESFIPMN